MIAVWYDKSEAQSFLGKLKDDYNIRFATSGYKEFYRIKTEEANIKKRNIFFIIFMNCKAPHRIMRVIIPFTFNILCKFNAYDNNIRILVN